MKALPVGHKDRAPLDDLKELPDYLGGYIEKYKQVSAHRRSGFSSPEPLLETLDTYDRKLCIDRPPEESEVLLTLDLIERSQAAMRDQQNQQQDNN